MVRWCEGTGQTSVPGRPTNFDDSRARASTALAVDAGGFVCFSRYLFFVLSPSLEDGLKKAKISQSLIAVGAEGVRVPLYLGHSW